MTRVVSVVGLVIALLVVGVAPALAAGGVAETAAQTSTPTCSSPPSQLGWYAIDSSSSPAVPTAGPAIWDANTVAVGYETNGPAVGFFVVSNESGETLGVRYIADDEAVHTDGLIIDLETNLSEVETVQVEWHCDANGNGEFEQDVDYAAGPRAGPTAIDFDATVTTPMTTIVTADAGRTPTSPTSEVTSPGQPGFSVLPSLFAIVVTAITYRRR